MNKTDKCNTLNDIITKYEHIKYNKNLVISKRQVSIYRNYKNVFFSYKVYIGVVYTLLKISKENGLPTIFASLIKQRDLLSLLVNIIRYNTLTPEELIICEHDIKNFTDRLLRVRNIVEENLIMTELYPYYKKMSEEEDDIFYYIADNGYDEAMLKFIESSKEYNRSHPEEYKSHLLVMNKAIDDYNMAKEMRDNKIKKEKKVKKEAQEAEKEMIQEIKNNNKKNRMRDKSLGIAGNSYYYKKKKDVI